MAEDLPTWLVHGQVQYGENVRCSWVWEDRAGDFEGHWAHSVFLNLIEKNLAPYDNIGIYGKYEVI